MENDEPGPVSVSRRIDAPAQDIFKLLAEPDRHPEFDGSGMLRPGAGNEVVAQVGDVFVMKMFFPAMGDYEMHNHVVVFERDRSIAWEPAMQLDDAVAAERARNGSRWRFDLAPDGTGATLVTETYDCSNSPHQVRQSVDNGNAWLDGMARTLELLDQLCIRE
jgi:RNA polymerase sigma-70 factor, ECF subfamily